MPSQKKIFLFAFILLQLVGSAQTKSLNNIDSLGSRFMKALLSNEKEKIWLQTDKQFYGVGETIWFKAYPLQSSTHKLSGRNNFLFADLVNNKDSVVRQLILDNKQQLTSGAIELNDSLQEGYYWLRCYSAFRSVVDTSSIAIKPVFVINPKKRNLKDTALSSPNSGLTQGSPVINFYPEGGSIISGINSTVAVSAKNKMGDPLITAGFLKDNHDSIVARFQTNKYGLTKFSFYPVWYKKYRVYVQSNNSYDSVYTLPAINFYAAHLSVVQQTSETVKVRVMLEDSVNSRDFTTFLLGVSGEHLCFAGTGSGTYETDIPLSNFSGGVASLLLFNDKQELISERCIYINKNSCDVTVRTNKKDYAARDHVTIDVNITDADHHPLRAALSVAVVDSNFTQDDNTEQQALYASAVTVVNDQLENYSAEEADLFMMIQKPEYKFWNNVETVKEMPVKDDDLFAIKGTLRWKKTHTTANGLIVTLLSNKDGELFMMDTTNEEGRFYFPLKEYYNRTEFNIQVTNKNGVKQPVQISLDSLPLPHFATPVEQKKKFDLNSYYVIRSKQAYHIDSVVIGTGKGWLTPVIVKAKKQTSLDEEIKKKRVSPFSHIITHDMFEKGGQNNVGNALLRVPGIQMRGGFITVRGGSGTSGSQENSEPLIVMDGVALPLEVVNQLDLFERSPVLQFLGSLNANTIDFLEVLTGPEAAAYGVRGGNGVIIINSKNTLSSPSDFESWFRTFYREGFHVPNFFEVPNYTNKELLYSKVPDQRITLFWDGDIITDTTGHASYNFFTGDNTGTYVVKITGVTTKGDIINKQSIIKVQGKVQ